MKKLKLVIKAVFGIELKEEFHVERNTKRETPTEEYFVRVCKDFRAVEKRLFICHLNEKQGKGTTDNFYGVFCRYMLLSVKMKTNILFELHP